MLSGKVEKMRSSQSSSEAALFKRDLTFTRRELREFTGWTNTRLHNHIKELVSMEYIIIDSGRINSIQTYKMLFNGKSDETFRQK
jgi:ABC-type molybdenum transport system ATPase subunit/photorepair protein PhrA